MPTRRAFLRASGAALGGSLLVQTVAADHFDTRPSHVTLEYDESYLDQYKPMLTMSYESQQKFLGLYGWVASSPEHDTNVCVYWTSYSHQDGWFGNLDSHHGDHEPVAVEVDKSSGDVVRVRASVYHWIKGEQSGTVVPMDGTNPRLKVVDPWHQYTAAEPGETAQDFPADDLTNEYQGWLDNGLKQDLLPGASTNPWKMQFESDWWRSDFFGISKKALFYEAAKNAGLGTVGSLKR